MDNLLQKYLKEYESLDDMSDEEDLKLLKKKRDKYKTLETVGSIAGDLARLGTLGGVAPKSSLPQYFKSQRESVDQDIGQSMQDKLSKRKDLLGKISLYKGLADDAKQDERYERSEEEKRKRYASEDAFRKQQADRQAKLYEDKLKDKTEKLSKPTPEEQKLRKILSEEEGRFNILNRNLNELESLIKTHGTINFFGPEKGDKESKIYQMAIDFAKVVDPESVAREGEVESARKYLLGVDWSTPSTALKRLESFRKDLEARRQAKHDSLGKYYKDMYYKYNPQQPIPRQEEDDKITPSFSRSDKSRIRELAEKTDVGDTFTHNGETYMVTGIGRNGKKTLGVLE